MHRCFRYWQHICFSHWKQVFLPYWQTLDSKKLWFSEAFIILALRHSEIIGQTNLRWLTLRKSAAACNFPSRVQHVQSVCTSCKSWASPSGDNTATPAPTSRCYYNGCKQWRKNVVLVQRRQTGLVLKHPLHLYSIILPCVRLCVHAALHCRNQWFLVTFGGEKNGCSQSHGC